MRNPGARDAVVEAVLDAEAAVQDAEAAVQDAEAVRDARTPPPARSRERRRRIALQKWGPAYILVAPATALVVLMMVFPTLQTLYFSFNKVALPLFETTFVGLKNYIDVFTDPGTSMVAQITLVWVVGTVVLRFALGFAAALIFNPPCGAPFGCACSPSFLDHSLSRGRQPLALDSADGCRSAQ